MKEKASIDPKLLIERGGRKYCPGCRKTKILKDFNNDRRTKDGLSRKCRRCRIKAQRAEKARYLRKVDALKAKVSCAKCGETRVWMLDYHHRDPKTKTASISAMRNERRPLKEIKKEIKKCVPLCANHHRELHYLRISLEEYLKEKK